MLLRDLRAGADGAADDEACVGEDEVDAEEDDLADLTTLLVLRPGLRVLLLDEASRSSAFSTPFAVVLIVVDSTCPSLIAS